MNGEGGLIQRFPPLLTEICQLGLQIEATEVGFGLLKFAERGLSGQIGYGRGLHREVARPYGAGTGSGGGMT